jgi:hypothetical protein
MRRVTGFGEVMLVENEIWTGPVGTSGPSQRLIDAVACGEATEGGLAEAGWRFAGKADWVRLRPEAQ